MSLYIPPKDQIQKVMAHLNQELAGAENIKSRQTRQSVLSAITSTREKLKLYKQIPENGLVLFCGVILMEDNKTEKKVTYDLEPYKPLHANTYKCQNTFYTEPLLALLEDDEKFGFIVMDGNGVLFATLQGSNKVIIQRMPVQLPKKHGRGGQSAVRFARLRVEKRLMYQAKCCELATQHFISDNVPNVKGIVIAGAAQLKEEMRDSEHFDPRLKKIVITTVDVSYGFDQGFNQAITLAAEALSDVKLVEEKKLISKFFEEISLDTGMIVFGVQDTMKAMQLGSLKSCMLNEEIEVMRYEIKNPVTGEVKQYFLNDQQAADPKYFKDQATGVDLEVTSTEPLADWLCMNYKDFGIEINFISDKSADGYQFCKGFGGIGGFLRYKMDVDDLMGGVDDPDNEDFDPDEDFI